MNYQYVYESLIKNRQKSPTCGYTERHHILPKSMGGSDDPTNLVVLSGREHWVAHLLLYMIHRNNQMLFACHMMAMSCEQRGIPFVRNSRMYQKIRIECARNVGKFTSKKGKDNSQYGTMWICNIELKENMRIKKGDQIPEGFVKGRSKWNEIQQKKRKRLKHPFNITDGKSFKRITFEDQLPIPEGWNKGGLKHTEETKKYLSQQALETGRNSGNNNGMHKTYLKKQDLS